MKVKSGTSDQIVEPKAIEGQIGNRPVRICLGSRFVKRRLDHRTRPATRR